MGLPSVMASLSKELNDLLHDLIMSEKLRVTGDKSQQMALEALVVYTVLPCKSKWQLRMRTWGNLDPFHYYYPRCIGMPRPPRCPPQLRLG